MPLAWLPSATRRDYAILMRRSWTWTCRALLLVSMVGAAPATLAAETTCALAVTVEGIEGAAVLQEKLTVVARREGACEARSWALRVAPAPRGAFMVALWNGKALETRFATDKGEVEPVASLLLRVAVAQELEVPAPAVSSQPSGESVPTASPSTETRTARAAAIGAASPTAVVVAVEAGPMVSAGGIGGRAGLLGLALGQTFGAGFFAGYGAQAGPRASRTEGDVGGIALLGASLGHRVWVGAAVEVGVSLQRGRGEVDSTASTASGAGLLVGGGGLILISPFRWLRLGSRVGVRWSSATATATSVTTVANKPPASGKAQGQGLDKPRTETAVDPASREASDAVGGAALALTLVGGIAF